MHMMATFLQLLLLFCINEWNRTEASQVGRSFYDTDENDKNALFDVIRRVENIEATNNYITDENKRLQDDVISLKKQILAMKANHESVVAELQTQLHELRSELSNKADLVESGVESDTKQADHEANDKVSDDDEVSSHIKSSSQGNPGDDIQTIDKKKHRELSDSKSEERLALRSENEVNIAFYATIGQHHIEHAGANQNILFDDVITNLGNAYNKYAGDFRAPVAGTYVFSVTLMAYVSHTTHYRIVKNGTSMGLIYLRGQDGAYGTSAVTAVLDLQKGDDVSIQNIDPDEYLFGYSYSMFSGFLLQQDFSSQAIVGK